MRKPAIGVFTPLAGRIYDSITAQSRLDTRKSHNAIKINVMTFSLTFNNPIKNPTRLATDSGQFRHVRPGEGTGHDRDVTLFIEINGGGVTIVNATGEQGFGEGIFE
jgi:hypothetical protein